MLGAIVGDIVGSRFEFNNHRSKDFELFAPGCSVTDDSIMTLAIAQAVLGAETTGGDLAELAVYEMQKIGRYYPNCGYGGNFRQWMFDDDPQPYYSFGNGAAMRVSPAGFVARDLAAAAQLAEVVTAVTHNHPEGIKGAQATAVAIAMARFGATQSEIRERIVAEYYPLNFTIAEIRPHYRFNETCQDTVPQAIQAFLEADSFEDAIRTAISVGGDSDTLAAITGSIAEAYWGVPDRIREATLGYLDQRLRPIFDSWEAFLAARANGQG